MNYFESNNEANFTTHAPQQLINRQEIRSVLFLEKVEGVIAKNYQDENFGLGALCNQLFLCRTQVYRKIVHLKGIPPSHLIKRYRLSKAKELLQTTDLTIAEIAYKVGFRDASYFSKAYKAYFGCLPSEA